MSTDIRLKEDLPILTERIVDTYAEVGSISHLGHCPLPNYETIVAATEDLMLVGHITPGSGQALRLFS